jgi:hypothetical protein
MTTELIKSEKAEFIENVKKWVAMDSQIKLINEKMQKIRFVKRQVLEEIIKYTESNQLTNAKIEITDGDLKFFEKKEYTPLSYSYLDKCLTHIISDPKQVEYIMRYIKENREIKSSIDIRRTYRENKT